MSLSTMTHLTIARPDDWHVHLRDGAMLADTVGAMARYFGRAIVMPNLVPPARTTAEAGAYRERILAARPVGSHFEPLMVLYLTDSTSPQEIETAKASGFVHCGKTLPRWCHHQFRFWRNAHRKRTSRLGKNGRGRYAPCSFMAKSPMATWIFLTEKKYFSTPF
jgi:hypothetical protein